MPRLRVSYGAAHVRRCDNAHGRRHGTAPYCAADGPVAASCAAATRDAVKGGECGCLLGGIEVVSPLERSRCVRMATKFRLRCTNS